MQRYLLIESRDTFGRERGGFCVELARALVAAGDETTVLLVQNGVLAAPQRRAGEGARRLGGRGRAGPGRRVLARRTRHRRRAGSVDGIRATPLDIVIDRMSDGWKVLWH